MRTFSTNLEHFQKFMNFSDTDIVEFSEVPESDLQFFKNQPFANKDNRHYLYTLCINCDIDFTSLFSDNGFVMRDLLTQYDKYPNEYKQIVTKHFFKYLKSVYKTEAVLREVLDVNMPDSKNFLTRLLGGTSYLRVGTLQNLQKAVSEKIPDDVFNRNLATIMFSKIINYNYNITRKYFKLSYQELSDYLGISPSGTSNWGGMFCASIPVDIGKALAKCLGEFEFEVYSTQFLHPRMLVGRKCELSLGSKLIDPPSDNTSNTPSKSSEMKAKEDLPKVDPVEIDLVENLSKSNCDSIENIKTVHVDVDDEKLLKMIRNLTYENKMKIKSLVTELFISQL